MKPCVGTVQRVIGLLVMVEPPERPAVGVVAQSAIRPEPSLVPVALLVAFGALERGSLIAGGEMAFLAGHDGMLANQRESRQIVFEKHFLVPAAGIVAVVAPVAEASLVHVVALVACAA